MRTKEHNQKIGQALIGRKLSSESIAKMREIIKQRYKEGRTVWNKGLTKETSEGVKKNSEARYGYSQEGWNEYGYKVMSIRGKRILEHHYVWMNANRFWYIPEGYVVHHVDQDKLNNNPNNLVLLTRAQHTDVHHALGSTNPYGWKN